ncbi:MAG: hypothetical protein [Microviridae sp.]|nr:MAG: hypothetical protein [Microviridae sp.]
MLIINAVLALLLVLNLKGLDHETPQAHNQVIQAQFLEWHAHPQEEPLDTEPDARRYPPIGHGVLPPRAGVENGYRCHHESPQSCGAAP